MRDLGTFSKIFLNTRPADFRKQAHGLALLVEGELGISPRNERCLFLFVNKRKTSIKMLYFDNSGYAMWWKNLEKEKFRWPKYDESTFQLSPRLLRLLLEGVDIQSLRLHKKIS